MYISELNIKGFRNFKNLTGIRLNKGLNVLIGENGVGKSAIIDAIRLLLKEDDVGRLYISDLDFYVPFNKNCFEPDDILINAKFSGLNNNEKIAYLPWLVNDNNMKLQLDILNKTNYRGRYDKKWWAGESSSSAFEWELIDYLDCIYLPPLRDAESKLQEGRGSRLSKFIKFISKDELEKAKQNNEPHNLEEKVRKFNAELCDDKEGTISQANDYIKKSLKEALGNVFSQDTYLQFSEVNFNRIVEKLRLLFYPNIKDNVSKDQFRNLAQNSLGYNNLLYIAIILAELTMIDDSRDGFKVLLIEEPEAHIHPQIQIKLLKYLNEAVKDKNIQIIITTHSPIIASSISINKIIHIGEDKDKKPLSVSINDFEIENNSLEFIDRWLDATKSVMLFSKGIILVEGIAEALLLPKLAKIVLKEYNDWNDKKILPRTLNEAGVTVVNMNGIYFKHFFKLFNSTNEYYIPINCSGITDNDPDKDKYPTDPLSIEGNNPALKLIEKYSKSENCRLYSNDLKTFEYDLAMEDDNLKTMFKVLYEIWPSDTIRKDGVKSLSKDYCNKNWNKETSSSKRDASKYLLNKIEDSNVGKGYYAQKLSEFIKEDNEISVPEYIKNAVLWACGGDINE